MWLCAWLVAVLRARATLRNIFTISFPYPYPFFFKLKLYTFKHFYCYTKYNLYYCSNY